MVHTTPTPQGLAQVIVSALEDAGISQRQAAESTTIARTTLTRNLRTGEFTVGQLAALSDLLQISVAELFARAEDVAA